MRKVTLLLLGGLLLGGAGCPSNPGNGTDDAGNNGGDDGGSNNGDGGPITSASITVHVTKISDGATTISFGLPVPPGVVSDASAIRVSVNGKSVNAKIKTLLREHDKNGDAGGVRAVLIQFPASVMTGTDLDVDVAWKGLGAPAPSDTVPFAQVSIDSPEVVQTAVRTITRNGTTYSLTESSSAARTLFVGRETRHLITYPEGYLAQTGLLGQQVTRQALAATPSLAGVKYLSDAVDPFIKSAMYQETYKLNPDVDSVVDPVVNYEGWLYDRCATFLTAYTHGGDPLVLRHAFRTCSNYSSRINLSGTDPGIWSGKPDPDAKYSHLRGVYAYYALTGDEAALASGTAMAEMWLSDPLFVVPYRQGHIRGEDKLWTERLLGTSLEGLYYGHRLTGDKKYLTAFGEMLTTAHKHITTPDQGTLTAINVCTTAFPPQSCWIHNAAQHAEGNTDEPWCSGWMSELTIDALLRYQEQTGDDRVDEIFVRLSRFLRDVGSAYFDSNPLDDTFLKPSVCYDKSQGVDVRRLVPLYGAGLKVDRTRSNFGDYSDYEHCADATALTAAALRSLRRQGKFDQGGPIGPFASEGASILQLHHEFSACAKLGFEGWNRPRRDPAVWTSSELAAGAADPAAFILANKIGFPVHPSSPQRKLSWWFNMSMLQFGLLDAAGVSLPSLTPGVVQPANMSCP